MKCGLVASARAAAFGAFVLGGSLLAACGPASNAPADSVTIGLLLPFTGTNSATANNFERAVIYAEDRVSDHGGGIKGRPLHIVSRDTHSSVERSVQSVNELIDAGAVVVVGPESADIAAAIKPILAERGVAFLSPLVGAADDSTVDCSVPWFRLAPSAQALGDALAKQIAAASATQTAVLYEADAYDSALRSAAIARLEALGGNVAIDLELASDAQSYAGAISRALAANADSVVLATSPRTAALVVNEFEALSATVPHWFLSPLLKTELLVQNVAPEALEGAIGVAPKIYDTTTDFAQAFSKNWQGDEPLEGAYFYYDAIGLIALSLEAGMSADGSFTLAAVDSAISNIASPFGESIGWNQIEYGLSRVRAGADLYYSGLTGPMLLNSCGPRRLGASSTWRVHNGAIVSN